jgi:quercetin dioxygenase-like cupin family protein
MAVGPERLKPGQPPLSCASRGPAGAARRAGSEAASTHVGSIRPIDYSTASDPTAEPPRGGSIVVGIKRVLFTVACLGFLAASPARAGDYPRAETVYQGDTTVMGEPIVYPPGKAEVLSVIVTLLPGEETGWHRHGVPLFGYILEGEVVVDYGERGTRTYKSGTGFMEAMATAHNGRNIGDKPCRILAVFMDAEGVKPTIPAPAPTR